MHPEDVFTFRRMVSQEPSPQVEKDCESLQKMLNRAHLAGPVGPIGVAMVALMHDYSAPVVAKSIGEVDWRTVPKGTAVLYQRGDEKREGEFQNLAAHGQVVVSFVGDRMPREIPPKYVKLVADLPEPTKNGKKKVAEVA